MSGQRMITLDQLLKVFAANGAGGVKTFFDKLPSAPAVECEVTIADKPMGVFRGKSRENLERVILFRMGETGMKASLVVTEISKPVSPPTANEPPAP